MPRSFSCTSVLLITHWPFHLPRSVLCYDDLSVTLQFRTAANGLMTTPIMQGMAFATAVFQSTTPVIVAQVRCFHQLPPPLASFVICVASDAQQHICNATCMPIHSYLPHINVHAHTLAYTHMHTGFFVHTRRYQRDIYKKQVLVGVVGLF